MNGPGGVSYYFTVSEFLAQPELAAGGFRINGKVGSGSIERADSGQDVSVRR